MAELKSHEAIAERFQDLRREAAQIASKLNDLAAETAEHEAVIKALQQLAPERKCFRLVGEVLVERTVKEVLPAVAGNKEQLDMISGKLKEQLASKRKELADFQEEYKIRIRSSTDVADDEHKPGPDASSSKAQGVLVSPS